jgi:hypothetical protein
MTTSGVKDEGLREKHAASIAKVRAWRVRANQARVAGRKTDADRCDDKVRDWVSRAKQIEQQLAQRTQPPTGRAIESA